VPSIRSSPPSNIRRSTQVTPSAILLKSACEATGLACELKRPADTVLSEFFRTNRSLGSHDRPFIAETVFSVLRNKRLLETIVPAPDTRRLVIASLVKLQGLSINTLQSLINRSDEGWLVEVKRSRTETLPSAERLSLPDWIWQRLVAQRGDSAAVRLGQALLAQAPLDLRVNTMVTSRDEVLKILSDNGLVATATPYSPIGVRMAGKPALHQHELFLRGAVEVQDEGSQLLGMLVAPRRGEMVVDFCAGAGGKTLLLGALMQNRGRLYAFDVSDKRLESLRQRLKRSALSNVHPQRISSERDPRVKRLAGKIDRVLVDAPCSGMGTLRRNPDIKWRQSPESVDELIDKQRRILAASARLLKPGGRLVYATCSLLREENEQVVEDFLAAENGSFTPVDCQPVLDALRIDLQTGRYFQVLPDSHQCDGFFAAILERVSAGTIR
jgi:16S rRNA (cytosine967-C5)-methyltransferase